MALNEIREKECQRHNMMPLVVFMAMPPIKSRLIAKLLNIGGKTQVFSVAAKSRLI